MNLKASKSIKRNKRWKDGFGMNRGVPPKDLRPQIGSDGVSISTMKPWARPRQALMVISKKKIYSKTDTEPLKRS